MKIHQAEADEAVLLCRALALLGYIGSLFQDHTKPLSERLQRIKNFAHTETSVEINPCDNRGGPDTSFFHQYHLLEVLSEEAVPDYLTLPQIIEEADTGPYCADYTKSPTTWVDRALIDELLLAQGSEPEFFMSDEGEDNQELE